MSRRIGLTSAFEPVEAGNSAALEGRLDGGCVAEFLNVAVACVLGWKDGLAGAKDYLGPYISGCELELKK